MSITLNEFLNSCDKKRVELNYREAFDIKKEFLALSFNEQQDIIASIKSYDLSPMLELIEQQRIKQEFLALSSVEQEKVIASIKLDDPNQVVNYTDGRYKTEDLYRTLKPFILEQNNQYQITESIRLDVNLQKHTDEQFAEKGLYEALKPFFVDQDDLENNNENAFFEFKKLDQMQENEIANVTDYEGRSFTIKKTNQGYFVCNNKDNNYYKAMVEITNDEETNKPMYISLTFNNSLDDKSDFLDKLKKHYYERCAIRNNLNLRELVQLGKIKEVAKVLKSGGANNNIDIIMTNKLVSTFHEKSTFLHLGANYMDPRCLDIFLNHLPQEFRRQYLSLQNADGKTVKDLVSRDRAGIIDHYLEVPKEEMNWINYAQNTHLPSVHKSADETLVRFAKNVLKNYKTNGEPNPNQIQVESNDLKDFTDKQCALINKDIKKLLKLTDKKLYIEFIAPTLEQFEQDELRNNAEKKQQRIDFIKFQITKAYTLLENVMKEGCVGNDYKEDANRRQANGLTIKEMIALCYNAASDENKLMLGVPYFSLDQQKKDMCKNKAKMAFINGLYEIRRGYNIEYGHDRPASFIFNKNSNDKNICAGGTINKIAESLESLNSDVEIRRTHEREIQEKIRQLLNKGDNIISCFANMVKNGTAKEKNELSTNLALWRDTNNMPPFIKKIIFDQIKEILELNQSSSLKENFLMIIEEYKQDYSEQRITTEILNRAIDNYKYPESLIEKLQVDSNKQNNIEAIVNYYKNNQISPTADSKSYMLTIEKDTKNNPELLKILINNYDVKPYYIKRHNQMVHFASEYLRRFDDFPNSLIPCIEQDPSSFKKVLEEAEKDGRLSAIVSNAVQTIRNSHNKKDLLSIFLKVLPLSVSKNFINEAKSYINSILDSKSNSKIYEIRDIINFFPAELRVHFIEEVNNILGNKELRNCSSEEIVRAFSEEDQKKFVKTMQDMIDNDSPEEVSFSMISKFSKDIKDDLALHIQKRNIKNIELLRENKNPPSLEGCVNFLGRSCLECYSSGQLKDALKGEMKDMLKILIEKKELGLIKELMSFLRSDLRSNFSHEIGEAIKISAELDCSRDVCNKIYNMIYRIQSDNIQSAKQDEQIEIIEAAKTAIDIMLNKNSRDSADSSTKVGRAVDLLNAFPNEQKEEFIDQMQNIIHAALENEMPGVMWNLIINLPNPPSAKFFKLAELLIDNFVQTDAPMDLFELNTHFRANKTEFNHLIKEKIKEYAYEHNNPAVIKKLLRLLRDPKKGQEMLNEILDEHGPNTALVVNLESVFDRVAAYGKALMVGNNDEYTKYKPDENKEHPRKKRKTNEEQSGLDFKV